MEAELTQVAYSWRTPEYSNAAIGNPSDNDFLGDQIAELAAPTTGHLICSCFNTASAGTAVQTNTLKHTGTISIEAAKRLCCDAVIIPVVENESGNVLNIGRRSRSIPPAIHRALEIREGQSKMIDPSQSNRND